MTELSLHVMEAYTRDVGRGIARIDYDSMDKLGCSTGDIISITGKRMTVAKCMPVYPSDENKGIVRTDGLVRNNCCIALGDKVMVEKVKALAAEIVTIIGLEEMPPIDARYFADACEATPMIVGDEGMIPYFGGRVRFRVIDIIPKDTPVLITQKTTFVIKTSIDEILPSEFRELFASKREDMIKSLKEALKAKNFDSIKNCLNDIEDFDLLAKQVKKVLNSEK